MRVALTVWGNRISPVFDSAQKLLIIEIENHQVVGKTYEPFDSESPSLLENLQRLDISVLICGAISERPANLIATSKIKLIPFITGNAVQVLEQYLSNKPFPPAYFMPGSHQQESHPSRS